LPKILLPDKTPCTIENPIPIPIKLTVQLAVSYTTGLKMTVDVLIKLNNSAQLYFAQLPTPSFPLPNRIREGDQMGRVKRNLFAVIGCAINRPCQLQV